MKIKTRSKNSSLKFALSSPRKKYPIQILSTLLALAVIVVLLNGPTSFGAGCGEPRFGGTVTNVNVGTGPRSLVLVDLNHDGSKDLAVANYGAGLGNPDGKISILLNNGSGGFSTPQNLTAGINPRAIVSGNFNNDSHVDLGVLNYVNGSCCITTVATILLGDGAGNFAVAGTPTVVGNDGSALATGDFNNDGKTDLAATVLGSSFGNVAILLGDGAGGFGAATLFTAQGNATSIAVGDVNADNKLDVVTSNLNGFDISVLLGNGAGAFSAPTKFPVGANPVSVALADINHDSKLDVVTATTGNTVSVLLGSGNGSFGAATQFPVNASPNNVFIGDLNGDGHPDAVTANSGAGSVSVVLGSGTGTFGSPSSYAAGLGSFFVSGSDLNGDSKIDLAVANISSNNVSVMIGDGLGGFGGARTFPVGLTPLAVAAADFNKDGIIDLVTPNANQNSVSVLIGTGNGNFGPHTLIPAEFSPNDVVIADFNSDDKLDLAVSNGILGVISILVGNGTGGFASPSSFPAGTNAFGLVSGDFNKDEKVDLAVIDNSDNRVVVLIGNGNGGFASPAFVALPGSPSDLAAADFNGDGSTDLVTASNGLSVLLGNGTGSFVVQPPVMVPATRVAVGDVNGDGKADVGVSTESPSGTVSVLLGDGVGGLGAPNSFSASSPKGLAFADFNNDGKIDLAVATAPPNVSIFLGNGAGGFGTEFPFSAVSPFAVLATDLTGDGRIDLATANSGGSVSVLVNTCSEAPIVIPAVSVNDITVAEGNTGQTQASFTVTLSATTDKVVTVSYYTVAETATAGVDYQNVSGQAIFPPGSTSQTIVVPVIGDSSIESNETFNVNLRDALNAGINRSKGKATITDDDVTTIFFDAASYTVNEGSSNITITVTRSGNLTGSSTVDYTTTDTDNFTVNCTNVAGNAFARCDFATGVDTLTFAPGETSKNFLIPIINDVWAEGNETFGVALSSPTGATLGTPATAVITINDNETVDGTVNPYLATPFFVRQHYLDFLSREPEVGEPWSPILNGCPNVNNDPTCDRLFVSQSIFGSQEFQLKGYYNYRFYKLAFNRLPLYQEIVVDMRKVTGTTQQDTFNRKAQFATNFVLRTEFANQYNGLSNTQYVNTLMNRYSLSAITTTDPNNPDTGGQVTLTTTDLINALNGSTLTRAQVLRAIADSQNVFTLEFNQGFVAFQYYGYLRRFPDTAGYNGWLTYMNAHPNDFRTMVNGFMNSREYRLRFGPDQ